MSVLFYRRPDYLNKSAGPITSSECSRYVERAKSESRPFPHLWQVDQYINDLIESGKAIPDGLSFEDVVEKKALPVSSSPS